MLSAFSGMGVVKGDRLEEFVREKVPVADIEDLKLPFAAVATDLNRGTRVVLDRGSVAKAVRASSSIPGIFHPLAYQDKLLVDGGLVDNIPVAVAREKGADIVIAVDISENVTNYEISNLVDVVLQSVNIMFSENVTYKKKEADVLITPAVAEHQYVRLYPEETMHAGRHRGRTEGDARDPAEDRELGCETPTHRQTRSTRRRPEPRFRWFGSRCNTGCAVSRWSIGDL